MSFHPKYGAINKKRIFVTDDDQDMLLLLCRILQDNGYEALGLPDATSIMNNMYEAPDMYILDKEMGDIDGLEVFKHLKLQEKEHHVPVFMISGSDCKAQANEAGIDCYLEKPIKAAKLIYEVEKYFRTSHSKLKF